MASPFVVQKKAALAGVPEYSYFVGTRYDAIPTTEFYRGFGAAFDDKSNVSVYDGLDMTRTLPSNRGDLGPHDTSEGLPGFHVFSREHQQIDLAPVLVRKRMPQAGQLQSCFKSFAQLPQGHRTHNGIRYVDLPELQQDKGWPIGVLFGAPTSRSEQRMGQVNDVEPFE